MKILIDNGHGVDTPGKRSPDGEFREYAWNRLIASRIVAALTDLGHEAQLLVPDQEDISLWALPPQVASPSPSSPGLSGLT